MALYGTKVESRTLCIRKLLFSILLIKGESNSGDSVYACKFAKMIHYWRQIWNQRTNGTTDIQFPFGFVQVSFTVDQTNRSNLFSL
jgi:hypothetical protein